MEHGWTKYIDFNVLKQKITITLYLAQHTSIMFSYYDVNTNYRWLWTAKENYLCGTILLTKNTSNRG